jgi:hypothetical protein
MKHFLTVLLLVSLIAPSCVFMNDKRVKGDGNIKPETREVSDFDEIHVSGGIDIYYTQGPVQPVRVETDANLQEFIEVYTNGNILNVRIKNNVSLESSSDIKVYVTAPDVNKFDAAGACHIIGQNKVTLTEAVHIDMSGACGAELDLHAPEVSVDMSGACSVDLRGETKNFSIEGSGSAKARCFDLLAENVEVDIAGAGNVETFASVKLDVEVSGAGTVNYKGNATVSKSISGAGGVNKVN